MSIRNIRFYDDSLQNILDVQRENRIDCRQVIPGKLIKPTFNIQKVKNSFNFVNGRGWVKKEGFVNYNEWLKPEYKTNYELYKEWVLSNGGWGEDEDLNAFIYLLENKQLGNNPSKPKGVYSKNYSLEGKSNHLGRRSFQDFYTGLTIPEMDDIINWSNYLKSQSTEGIILFDFDGVINLGNGILLWDIFEDDFNHSSNKFGRNITFEGFVKFFVGTKERFDKLREMFAILLNNQTYFFILTFMGRCGFSNIYKRFLQVLNPNFEYCKAFNTIPSRIQTGNIMCCTDDIHIKTAREMYIPRIEGESERNYLKKTPTKLQFLHYFLGEDLSNWFNNSLFKPQLINPLNSIDLIEGGKRKKEPLFLFYKKEKAVRGKKKKSTKKKSTKKSIKKIIKK